MKEIPLTKGKVALVDDEDYERLVAFKWQATCNSRKRRWYATCNINLPNGQQTKTRMHRFILNAPKDLQVDHQNGDGLDNRRNNLRLATNSQNQQNRSLSPSSTSGFKGVSFHRGWNLYRARIYLDRKQISLGYFADARSAAIAYDASARKLFGKFAKTNF